MGIPDAMVWIDVLTVVGNFLGGPLVAGAMVTLFGLLYGKQLAAAMRDIVDSYR